MRERQHLLSGNASQYSPVINDCIRDRLNVVKMGQDSWIRRSLCDLLCKMALLLCNSIGRKTSVPCIYVDEIKNSNMCRNLEKTAFTVHGDEASFLRFYSKGGSGHYKAGVLWTIAELTRLLINAFPPIVGFMVDSRGMNEKLAVVLARSMERYVSRFDSQTLCVLMTDHHFFSTVVAETHSNSVVLQHGLMQDARFFSPVRASALCCWSKKSVSLVDRGKGVDTGTFKFTLSRRSFVPKSVSEVRVILLCLARSKTASQIRFQTEPILRLKEKYGFALLIKTHPGSFFSLDELEDYVGIEGIKLYKEERIEDLDFDFAIIEESTAVLDVACLGVPFIICEDIEAKSYFDEYSDRLPVAKTADEVEKFFESFDFDKNKVESRRLLESEIDGGRSMLGDYLLNRCNGFSQYDGI